MGSPLHVGKEKQPPLALTDQCQWWLFFFTDDNDSNYRAMYSSSLSKYEKKGALNVFQSALEVPNFTNISHQK